MHYSNFVPQDEEVLKTRPQKAINKLFEPHDIRVLNDKFIIREEEVVDS